MRNIRQRVLSVFSDAAQLPAMSKWLKSHREFVLIFNWHQITPSFDPQIHHRYTWTALNRFKATIEYLSTHFRIVPLGEAVERIKSGSFAGRRVALTFDDGDISMADYVLPMLRGQNLPATFFINTAYLGSDNSYWFPVLSYARPSLSAELKEKALKLRTTDDPVYYDDVRRQVEQRCGSVPKLRLRLVSEEWLAGLDGDQFSIGAHGHEHQRYSMMPRDWQLADLSRNVKILSQFRAYRPLFAVPFGRPRDWNLTTLEVARALGLDVLLADGGVNLAPSTCLCRQPADSQSARKLVAHAVLRSPDNPQRT